MKKPSKTRRRAITIPDDLWRQAKRFAKAWRPEERPSVSAVVRHALVELFERQAPKDGLGLGPLVFAAKGANEEDHPHIDDVAQAPIPKWDDPSDPSHPTGVGRF